MAGHAHTPSTPRTSTASEDCLIEACRLFGRLHPEWSRVVRVASDDAGADLAYDRFSAVMDPLIDTICSLKAKTMAGRDARVTVLAGWLAADDEAEAAEIKVGQAIGGCLLKAVLRDAATA